MKKENALDIERVWEKVTKYFIKQSKAEILT